MNRLLRYMYSREVTRMDRLMLIIAIGLMFYSIMAGLIVYTVSMIIEVVVLNNKRFVLSQLKALKIKIGTMI